jgi:hypothetical protein
VRRATAASNAPGEQKKDDQLEDGHDARSVMGEPYRYGPRIPGKEVLAGLGHAVPRATEPVGRSDRCHAIRKEELPKQQLRVVIGRYAGAAAQVFRPTW